MEETLSPGGPVDSVQYDWSIEILDWVGLSNICFYLLQSGRQNSDQWNWETNWYSIVLSNQKHNSVDGLLTGGIWRNSTVRQLLKVTKGIKRPKQQFLQQHHYCVQQMQKDWQCRSLLPLTPLLSITYDVTVVRQMTTENIPMVVMMCGTLLVSTLLCHLRVKMIQKTALKIT